MEIKQTAKRILTCSLAALMLAGTAVTVLPQVTDGSGIKVQAATPDSSFEFRECIGNNGKRMTGDSDGHLQCKQKQVAYNASKGGFFTNAYAFVRIHSNTSE